MVHPDDYDAMEKLFRGQEVPEDLIAEYELQRYMANAFGHSGAMGMQFIIPMMRALGYGRVVEKQEGSLDWRTAVGSAIVAQYGDQIVNGTMVGFGSNGRLVVTLDGYSGEIELPRYCVKPAPEKVVEVEKPAEVLNDPWSAVSRGTRVVVSLDDRVVNGRFIKTSPGGLTVKVGTKEMNVSPGLVELAP